jgi:hypothetical protein
MRVKYITLCACGNHTLRIEINLVRIEVPLVRVVITFVAVKITLPVEITLCVWNCTLGV